MWLSIKMNRINFLTRKSRKNSNKINYICVGRDAGDPGASGCGYKEANLTRELVNLIAPKLRKYATVDVYNGNRSAFYDV